ncbi:MAG TPA: ATP-binding protein, partial [Candidatus Binatia bacterium]|nr:ATP-binding protein [Candidatus Binatia bacterium]
SRNVAPEEMVEDALLRAGPLLDGHRVDVAISAGLPSPKVDPRLISQVIFTLLENAAKYSGPESRISIAVRQKENNICFAIDDEGPGIPSELRGRVFDKFFRAGFHPGLGMGLAIARGIVQAHGGKIWIEDGPARKGTSVQFMIPLQDAPSGQTAENAIRAGVSQNDVPRHDDVAIIKSFRDANPSGEHS